ncbi:MAG: serine/threonine-protein kinase [Dokdonella sp.]
MTRSTPMDPQRWQRLRAVLDHALDLEGDERSAFLATLPALDDEFRDDLLRLLAQHARDEQNAPFDPVDMAASLLADAAADANDADRVRVGQHVGAFTLLRLIGTGGMGAVYLAERHVENFAHRVALKVMRAESASAAARERFERERQILANLVHPHIGTLFEGGQTEEGQPYYTMEYVDGVPITDYCRDRQLGVEQRVRLLIDVAGALSHAHQSLVVHRDIKPSNILVTASGAAKLLDFGIAKRVGIADAAATQALAAPMTPEYAAPEQFRNEAITVATDVYQFGVLCFRVLTGSLPYRADSQDNFAWARAVTTDEPTLLSRALDAQAANHAWIEAADMTRVKRQLRGDLDAIVRKALAKMPQDRYRSMDAMIADLEAFLAGRPVAARRATALYFMRRFVARKPFTVAAASVIVFALIAATAISVQAARRAALQAHRAEVANRFLLTALDLTDRFSGNNAGDLTLADVLEHAVAQAHTELRDEPQVRADVLAQLSLALQHQGKIAAALTAVREAHDIRVEQGSDGVAIAAAAQQLASLEIESGQLDDAARHLDETLQQIARMGGGDSERIQAFTSLGKLSSMRGDAQASLRWYRQIIPLRQSLAGDHAAELAMDYNNLGTGLHNLSRFVEADAAYVHGIDLLRERFGASHPRIGFIEYSRSATLIQLGRFDEASALLDAADLVLAAGASGNAPGSVNTDRLRAVLDYFHSDYASALRRIARVLPQTRSGSPITVAYTFSIRGRIELAAADAQAAARSFAEAERLFVSEGRADHRQRWYAHGLHGVARATTGAPQDLEQGDAELHEALVHVRSEGARTGIEEVELALYGGAAARRRGDVAAALVLHRRADTLQRQMGWLGELGVAHVEAELAQDGMMAGADVEARDAAGARRARSIEVMQRIAPHDPRLAPLLALQRSTESG